MMKLYEVRNGYTGESYVRCYVVAQTEERAIELAREKYKEEAHKIGLLGVRLFPDNFYTDLEAEELLDVSIEGATDLSD